MEFTKGLTRSVTFDHRGRKDHQDEENPPFTRLTKRAQTFIEPKRNETFLSTKGRPSFNDIAYRRYFGMETQQQDVKLIPPITYNKELQHDLSPSFIPQQEASVGPTDAVIVVDTFSTGALMAHRLYHSGYKVICVLSGDLKDLLNMMPDGVDVKFEQTFVLNTSIEYDLAVDTLVNEMRNLDLNILSIFAGAETGVELTDELSEKLNLRTNGTALTDARRNKYIMGETIRAAGLRAVRQLRASQWHVIEEWIAEWNPIPFKVIVKPMDSAGSDDVTLCSSLTEVKKAFGNILGKINGLGIVNREVLVQEYLEGQEYVIDIVSRDGEHKVVGIWSYDRRAVNGAGFVCFGQRMLTADEPHCRELIDYQKKVITALGIRNGPTHGEVKWFKGEPVLVEVGARCHGGDGLWVKVIEEALGYSQVGATIYAYLNKQKFDELPNEPIKRIKYGTLKWLVNYKEGIFHSTRENSIAEIKAMGSYRGYQIFISKGKKVAKTQNCFTWGGCVTLVHEDESVLLKDYQRLEELEKTSLFFVEALADEEVKPIVVVVDPFSTGAVLASDLVKRGYSVIALYSAKLEQLADVQDLVPPEVTLVFDAVIAFEEDISLVVDKILDLKRPVLAIFVGAETGVEYADQLSERMNLRTNGSALSEARRNKYLMGETVRAAGLRAVKELQASKWEEIVEYLNDWKPNPYKLIVKPLESAGSDGVTLCYNIDQVKAAFDKLIFKVNGLGIVNRAVLVQEFLEGDEYIVDTCSRDGVHKVIALWIYDRREANGAGFVCFGYKSLSIDDPYCREIVNYQLQVITALGIKNGPAHGEVKWCNGEPVLVEVGARCHGAEGAWQVVAKQVAGYDQINATIDAFLEPAKFNALPDVPSNLHAFGRMLYLVLPEEGYYDGLNEEMVQEIESMSSFILMEIFLKKGQYQQKTIDCFTLGGGIRLAHKDNEQVVRDYNRIREMELTGLFKLQKK